jgi:serine/threonine protein kinase
MQAKHFDFLRKKQNFLGEFWEEVWKTVAAKSLSQSTLFVKYNGIYRQPETKEKYLVIELLYTDLQNHNAQLESDIQEFITEPQEQRLQELDNLKFRLQILKTIAAGVKLLHNDLRIIHRDLALRNVMLRRSLQPVLIDLGYSVFEHDKYKPLPFPIYTSAPELIEENKPEFASDIFSFGCLTVELLCCKSISKFINEDEKKKKNQTEHTDLDSLQNYP